MIVKVNQTTSNVKQSFDVELGEKNYVGETGRFSRFQSVTLKRGDTTLEGRYYLTKWKNYIPLRPVFGIENLTKAYRILRNGEPCGSMALSKHGFLKNRYVITLDDGAVLYCYKRLKGSFGYVSVYCGDEQIALIETYLNVNDLKYTHKLYIPDEYSRYSDVLSLFVLYYANLNFTKRFHMSRGSRYRKAWTVSRYNGKYDPKWLENHFPNENYFGKISSD